MPLSIIGLYAFNGAQNIQTRFSKGLDHLRDKGLPILTTIGGPSWTFAVTGHQRPKADRAYPVQGERGLVLGRLFDSPKEGFWRSCETEISPDVAQRAMNSSGSSFCRATWGRYVAVFTNADRTTLHIQRDPSGFQNLFCIPLKDCLWFGSQVDSLIRASALQITADDTFLAHFLLGHGLKPSRRTGITNLLELLPGETLTLSPSGFQFQTAWHLSRMAEDHSQARREKSDLVKELRSILQYTVTQWAQSTEKAAIHLSGGIDSSCVLGLLRKSKNEEEIHNFTYYGHQNSLNELRFAELASSANGTQLSAVNADPIWEKPPEILFNKLKNRQTSLQPRPSGRLLLSELDEIFTATSKALHCDSIWTGLGGDLLFDAFPSEYQLIDHWKTHGIKENLSHAMKIARRINKPVWQILRETRPWLVKKGKHLPAVHSHIPADTDHIFTEALINLYPTEEDRFPEWENISNPAKHDQLFHLTNHIWESNCIFHTPTYEDFEIIHPLLSQPIVEWSAKVPIYLHFQDVGERDLFREACRDVLPADIRNRYSKGDGTAPIVSFFHRNARFVSEILSSGYLHKNGYIDKTKLDRALSQENTTMRQDTVNFMEAYATELWMQNFNAYRSTLYAER